MVFTRCLRPGVLSAVLVGRRTCQLDTGQVKFHAGVLNRLEDQLGLHLRKRGLKPAPRLVVALRELYRPPYGAPK